MTVHISPLPTEAPPIPDAGMGALTTGKGNLPLEAVDVHAHLTGLVGGVRIAQTFRNPHDVPLEATYVFPLPDRAAVTAMRMEAADRVVEGTLKERGRARADYDAAIASGRRAAIAEEDRPDVFTMRVGNIMPGERVTVRLGLAQPLPYEFGTPAGTPTGHMPGEPRRTAEPAAAEAAAEAAVHSVSAGAATFRFPLVVAPRYIPGAALPGEAAGDGVAPDTDAVPDASRISPPVLLPGFPDPVRLSFTVDIDPAGLPLTELSSSLHVIAVEPAAGPAAEPGPGSGTGPEAPRPGRTTVRLQPGERLDRDFVLRLGFAAHEAAALSLVPGPDGPAPVPAPDRSGPEGTFTLTVLPSGQAMSRPRDVALVLDRSGSMAGWKMVAARRAAARIVDTLTTGDRFAVLSFDDRIEWPAGLPEGLVAATDRNRFRAVEHLAGLEARWGTEMLQPLEHAAGLLRDAERDRVLVLITDGQVGNEDEILARVDPVLQGVRVHTVGIDRAINAGFLGRLALLGQGRSELVESEDRLDEAMEQIHHRIAAPLLTALSVEASGIEIVPDTVTPHRLGALFPGVPLVIAGRYRLPEGAAHDTVTAAVTLSGRDTAGTVRRRHATGTVTAGETGEAAVAVWARGHLRDLEDRYVVGPSEVLERQITATSLRFGVLCRFTAFVAVDSRVVTGGATPHRVVQPVEPPSGWGGSGTPETAGLPSVLGSAAPGAVRPMTAPAPAPAPQAPAAPVGPAGAAPAPARARTFAAPRRLTRGSARQGFAGTGAVPASAAPPPPAGGFPGAAPPAKPPAEAALASVRPLLRAEAERLAGDLPRPDRWRHLSDLRTRLSAVLAALAGAGVPDRVTTALGALVSELAAADDPARRPEMDDLWERARTVLTAFVTGPAYADGRTGRPFWKRDS